MQPTSLPARASTTGFSLMPSRSESLYERALKRIPAGVNSPVRAFRAVGGTPLFFERASGAPTGAEVELAEAICRLVPSIELVRLVSSGTEATMTAIRLARGFTGRGLIA